MSSRLLLLAILIGCPPLTLGCWANDEKAREAARSAQWEALEREHEILVDLRAQLAAARAEEAPEPVRELEGRVGQGTDRFLERLIAFINQHAGKRRAGVASGTGSVVAEAIALKSAEDLLLAREHIDLGGDYAKAIDILRAALEVDAGNPELVAALEEAERLRYMDAERFSRIERGMTDADVLRELGRVLEQNVRRSEDGRVAAWLYPREGGAAAAVFFDSARDGSLVVYDTDFEAVATTAERSAEEGAGEESPAN